MARTFGDLPLSNLLTSQDWSALGVGELPIGGTGAPGTWDGPAEVTFTRSSAGTYTMTYPPAVKMKVLGYIAKSAAVTVVDLVVTAKSATAGTASFQTLNAAGAATDPASGDILGFLFFAKTKASGA